MGRVESGLGQMVRLFGRGALVVECEEAAREGIRKTTNRAMASL